MIIIIKKKFAWYIWNHDDVIKWKHFRVTAPLWCESTGGFPSQSQWRGALINSLICAWRNGWASHLRSVHSKFTATNEWLDITISKLLISVWIANTIRLAGGYGSSSDPGPGAAWNKMFGGNGTNTSVTPPFHQVPYPSGLLYLVIRPIARPWYAFISRACQNRAS